MNGLWMRDDESCHSEGELRLHEVDKASYTFRAAVWPRLGTLQGYKRSRLPRPGLPVRAFARTHKIPWNTGREDNSNHALASAFEHDKQIYLKSHAASPRLVNGMHRLLLERSRQYGYLRSDDVVVHAEPDPRSFGPSKPLVSQRVNSAKGFAAGTWNRSRCRSLRIWAT